MRKRKNKRRAERHDCYVPIECKKGTVFDESQTVDISQGGLGFIVKTEIPLAQKIPVEIVLSSHRDPVLVMGQIKWIQPLSDPEQYRVGMEFAKILAGSRDQLNQHLCS